MQMRATRTLVLMTALFGSVVLVPAQSGKPATAAYALQTTVTPPSNAAFAGLNFMANVGSFKALGSEKDPVQGTLEMTFTGTVLVSGLFQGSTVNVSGSVRKEYETKDHSKQVYFGTGRLVLSGKARAVQFFGRDMKARFYGMAIFRLYGEFDKNLDTGSYWFDGGEKVAWGTGGMPVVVPNAQAQPTKARVRINGGSGK